MAKTTKRVMKKSPKPEYVTKQHFDGAIARIEERFVTKQHFEERLGALEARMDNNFVLVWEAIRGLGVDIRGLGEQLSGELARHTKAILEHVSAQIRVVDEKYADLPGRVAVLGAKVTG